MQLRLILLFLALFSLLSAEEQSPSEEGAEQKKETILPLGVTIDGDYFVMGSNVEISGRVTGDVYAVGTQVIVDGQVDGDLLIAAGSFDFSGRVGGNVRALAGQAVFSGSVGENVTIVAANVQLIPSGAIGGNLVLTSGSADLSSSVGGEVTAVASSLRLSGGVGRSVDAYVGHMRVTSKARIGGDLVYKSDDPAQIEPQASIVGKVTHHTSYFHEVFKGRLTHILKIGSKITGLLMNFFYTFVIGWIMLRLYPQNLERAMRALSNKPVKALVYGVMLLVLLPLASLIFLMSILGAPFALALIALNVIGFYSAKVLTIFWASNRFFKKFLKPNTLTIFFVGLVCYFALTAVPLFGSLVALAAMLFGLGAVPLAKLQQRH